MSIRIKQVGVPHKVPRIIKMVDGALQSYESISLIGAMLYSGTKRPKTKKATRKLLRPNKRPNFHARATNLLYRVRKHKPRNPRSDEECRCGYEADTRQDDHGGRGYYNVLLPHSSSLRYARRDTDALGDATGNNSANNTNSPKKSATP